jgi:hypothetical protein
MTVLLGTVTTVVQAQADNTKYIAHPASGTDVDLCAVKDITGAEVGSLFTLPAAVGSAMLQTTAGGAVFPTLIGAYLPSGTVVRMSCAASNTGNIRHSMWYIPIDPGASVAAN